MPPSRKSELSGVSVIFILPDSGHLGVEHFSPRRTLNIVLIFAINRVPAFLITSLIGPRRILMGLLIWLGSFPAGD